MTLCPQHLISVAANTGSIGYWLDVVGSVDVVARGEILRLPGSDTVFRPFDIQFIDFFLITLLQRLCLKPEEGVYKGNESTEVPMQFES